MATSSVIALRTNLEGQRIARVVSISGARLIALLDAGVGDDGAGGPRAPQIGELVKVVTRGSTAFGIVTGLNIPLPEESRDTRELRITEIELIGEIEHDDGGADGSCERAATDLVHARDEAAGLFRQIVLESKIRQGRAPDASPIRRERGVRRR